MSARDQKLDAVANHEPAVLLELVHDAIFIQGVDGLVEFWNASAERLYGWPRQMVLGAHSQDLMLSHISRELLEAQAAVLTTGHWSGELIQTTRDGRAILTHCRLRLVRDPEGAPRSILVVSTDLTERRRLEQQFLRAQRLQCLGSLASGVAHDLNNVFSPILMVAECLADRLNEPGDPELLQLMRSSAERGAAILKQLLTFSRAHEVERVELPVGQILKDITRLARETFPRNITVSTQTAPNLWRVDGDLIQMHQVILNLCLNARDALPQGGRIRVSATNLRTDSLFCQMTPQAEDQPYVRIEVHDSGSGVSAALLNSLLDPTSQAPEAAPHTGLGLAAVRNIIQAHHGFLEVQSHPGEGTHFRIHLPAVPPKDPEPAPHLLPPVPPANGERILILDDEEAVCESLGQVLLRHSYAPVTATNGNAALQIFTQDPAAIHCVITDLMMPGMHGLEFIHAIRRLSAKVPILVMSGALDHRDAAAHAAGPRAAFLEKPFTAGSLLQALREVSPLPTPDPLPA